MAKYLTEFNTYAEYSAATLSYPNVSLIKSTGKVYYKNLFAGASLGDILMWDNVNSKLVTTFNGNWDSTTYPISQYEPIAINVYPADQASDGKSRYMSLKFMTNTSNSGSTTAVKLYWGLSQLCTSTDTNTLNGKENTDAALLLADGTTANTQAAFAAFVACNNFRTNGTTAGNWYLPSYGELSLYISNYSDINSKIQAIINVSSSIVSEIGQNRRMLSSTEYSQNNSYVIYNGSMKNQAKNNNDIGNGNSVRAMLAL